MVTFEHEVDLDEIAEQVQYEDPDDIVEFIKQLDEYIWDFDFTLDLTKELLKVIIAEAEPEQINDLKEILLNSDKDKKIKELEEELKHLREVNKCS